MVFVCLPQHLFSLCAAHLSEYNFLFRAGFCSDTSSRLHLRLPSSFVFLPFLRKEAYSFLNETARVVRNDWRRSLFLQGSSTMFYVVLIDLSITHSWIGFVGRFDRCYDASLPILIEFHFFLHFLSVSISYRFTSLVNSSFCRLLLMNTSSTSVEI